MILRIHLALIASALPILEDVKNAAGILSLFKRGDDLVDIHHHHHHRNTHTHNSTQTKMKLFALLLILRDVDAVSRHPITRLAKLTQFSEEMLDQWFKRIPSHEAWKRKFAINSDRLKRNFERGNGKCGFYDPERIPHGGLTQEEIEKHIQLVAVREEARQLRYVLTCRGNSCRINNVKFC